MISFSDPGEISGYEEKTARLVPGLRDLHRMVGMLLGERAPTEARILVLGAGGGLELKAFVETYPGWRFDGVDPSPEMLQLARSTLGSHASRVEFHEGTIDCAPAGPFDAATCLLTLHFLPKEERLRTVQEVYRRLKPGAPFVVIHHSIPDEGDDRDRWLARSVSFGAGSGTPADQIQNSVQTMKERLPLLTPEEDETVLKEAGFVGVEMFFAAFTFKGWVGYRS